MKKTPAKELRNMSATDLAAEVAQLRQDLAKQRMGIAVRSEKDTARYARGKRQLARLLTVLGEKKKSAPALKKAASSATVSAPKAK